MDEGDIHTGETDILERSFAVAFQKVDMRGKSSESDNGEEECAYRFGGK
jgi:hypothetical protein